MLRSRYRRITFFFARVIAGLIFWELFLPRIGLSGQTNSTRSRRMRKIATSYRALAVQMGGVLIKVGQFLSTRVDVLPVEITEELAGLQDEVPAEPFALVRQLAEKELGKTLEETFAYFDTTPLAAASLGQAHRARLRETEYAPNPDGDDRPITEVVVKIQRPNIEAIIQVDMEALFTVGRWLQRYPPIQRRANVPMLLNDLNRSLQEEVDYIAEAENAEIFASNFRRTPGIRVPAVLWGFTSRRVLTLENVLGIKITDFDAVEAAGIDRPAVAERLFKAYLKQIFEDGFFHADPHPGNLFVEPDGDGFALTFIDFGMVGRVPPTMAAGLREMLIGGATRDARRSVRSYQMLGILLPNADIHLLERAEARLFERLGGKTMTEIRNISFAEMETFAKEFRELLYEMPFQIPQDLIWLGRTVAILSGMCTAIHPDFNLWETVTPYAQKVAAEETLVGWEFWKGELLEQLRVLVTIPRKFDRAMDLIERGELEVRNPEQTHHLRKLDKSIQRLTGGIIFSALLLGSVQLHIHGAATYSGVLLGAALVILGWLVVTRP